MVKKKFILDAFKYIFFFGVGIALFIWVYRGQDLGKIVDGLAEFNYGWIGASLVAFLFSHLFRAMRWRMLIESIGYKPRLVNTFLSILVMYLANSAITRMGEVTRCGILKKYDGVPFTSQLGTVLIERIVDMIFLLILLFIVLVLNWSVLSTFVNPDPAMVTNKFGFLSSTLFLTLTGLLLLVAAGAIIFRKTLLELAIVKKILSYGEKFVVGLKSVFRLKQPLFFIVLTAAVYGCYYLSTFFVFKAFGPTSALSPMVAFAVLALASLGMVLPIPNGIGPFDWIALNTLILYGVNKADGQLVTLVLHGSTTLFIIVSGALALGILPIVNKKNGETKI